MKKNKQPVHSSHVPSTEKPPEENIPTDQEEPITPENDPDIILDEELIVPPPYEPPQEGEGP